MSRTLRVVVACGGTGGHVFPGLATAGVLRLRGVQTALMLSGRSLETPLIAGWEGDVLAVRCPAPRWRSPVGMIKGILSLSSAFLQARRLLRQYRADVLLGMGSYTSVGPVLAARSLRIPVVLHEANAVPGTAVAKLAKLAAYLAISFPESETFLPESVRTVNTGMPVRTGLAQRPPFEGFDRGLFTVLVMGGSQGAQRLNRLAVEAFSLLAERKEPCRVIHLAGLQNRAEVAEAYAAAGVEAEVFGFLEDMGSAYASADLCISRSGAAACFELCLCGPPALLVPYPEAVRNHQLANAMALANAGAAEVLLQEALTGEFLAERIATLRDSPARRDMMKAALRSLARPDAAENLADLVEAAAEACTNGNGS